MRWRGPQPPAKTDWVRYSYTSLTTPSTIYEVHSTN